MTLGVTLEVKERRESLNDARSLRLIDEDAGVLSHVLFKMPIFLRIDDTVIMNWPQLPLLFVAYDMLDRLRRLPKLGKDTIVLPGGSALFFTMEGSDVIVESREHDRTAKTPYSTLLSAWEAFSHKTRTLLIDEFPELRSHPAIGAWFREPE